MPTRDLPDGKTFITWEQGHLWRWFYERVPGNAIFLGMAFRDDAPSIGRAKGWYAGHSSRDYLGATMTDAADRLRERKETQTPSPGRTMGDMTTTTTEQYRGQAEAIAQQAQALADGTVTGPRWRAVQRLRRNVEILAAWTEDAR